MKLLTKELIKRFEQVGSQENVSDPIVIAKFFNPVGQGTWLATEYDKENEIFFGYVSIYGDYCDEWGSFSLRDLEDFKGMWGLKIERDIYFTERKASELIKELTCLN